jgi:hypothetical protein
MALSWALSSVEFSEAIMAEFEEFSTVAPKVPTMDDPVDPTIDELIVAEAIEESPTW